MRTLEDIVAVLRIAHEIDNTFYCRVTDDGDVTFMANVNDTFSFATADCEPISTREDVAVLRSCIEDLKATGDDLWDCYVEQLYAARKRGERPAGFCYTDERGWLTTGKLSTAALFDAAGPHRTGSDCWCHPDAPPSRIGAPEKLTSHE